jgi:hypothetical protein
MNNRKSLNLNLFKFRRIKRRISNQCNLPAAKTCIWWFVNYDRIVNIRCNICPYQRKMNPKLSKIKDHLVDMYLGDVK